MVFSSKKIKTYKDSGVDVDKEEEVMRRVVELCHKTFRFRLDVGNPVIPISHFAGIIKISQDMGLALKTDGVGTKVFIAQLMDNYDTIGIDCVAMNVNDILCVGAEPLSFVDYIAIQKPDPKILEEIMIGLVEGARRAKVTIVGGETAQLPEIILGKREGCGFDLTGMCVGMVPLEKIVTGQNLVEGDVVLGLESSGIHSNGLTLARKILLEKSGFNVRTYIEELDRTLGEELLEPTKIYVSEILEMLKAGLHLKVMAHITGKGLLNLLRVGDGFGYFIEKLPKPPAIFKLIQKHGEITDEEMYRVYNMGVGFCLVLPKEEVDEALQILDKYKVKGFVLGKAVKDPERKMILKPRKLVGTKSGFKKI